MYPAGHAIPLGPCDPWLSTEKATVTRSGRKVLSVLATYSVTAPAETLAPHTSNEAYENPSSGVTWIVENSALSVPFIE